MVQYPCDTCGKVFKQQAHLDRHLSNKKGCSADTVKPHVCICGKRYSQSQGLSRHRQVCKGPQCTLEEEVKRLREQVQTHVETDAATAQRVQDVTQQLEQAREELAVLKASANDKPVEESTRSINSCGVGSIGDLFQPAVYFGLSGHLLVPEEEVDGTIIKFGQSLSVPERIAKDHVPDFGGFDLLDCVKCINPVIIEQKLKRLLDMESRRIKCKTVNKAYRDTEVFVARSQDEYASIVHRCVTLAKEHEKELLGIDRALMEARSAQKESEIKALTLQLDLIQNLRI